MRTKLTLVSLMGLLTIAFIFNTSSTENTAETKYNRTESTGKIKSIAPMMPSPVNGRLDKFYVGAISDDADYHCNNCNPFTQLDQLGFNLWHQYVSADTIGQKWYPASPFAWADDNLFAGVSTYAGGINDRVSDIYSHNGRRLLMTRPKIEYLCYGQRSDYQCETISTEDDLWFYSFQSPQHSGSDIPDNSQYGEGQYVRYCQKNINQTDGGAGWVVQKLKANTEQCKPGPRWQGDTQSDWLIKPRIRLDQNFANNPANLTKLVCKITVKNDDGNIIKEADIRVRNFKKELDSTYAGNYIEEYYFSPYSDTSRLNDIHGAWGDQFKWKARGNESNESLVENHADIQVYWYGQCDMWIDYVRVDNDIADRLLNPNNPLYPTTQNWLDSEVTQIGNQTIGGNYPILQYYIELFEFNNIPCIAYVNNKINSLSGGQLGIVADLTPDNISFHVPEDNIPDIWNADFLNEHYIQKVNPSCLYSQSYPLNACYSTNQSTQIFSKIPETIQSDSVRILGKKVPVAEYEDWLQTNLDHKPSVWEGGTDVTCGEIGQWRGDFRSALEMCDALSKISGKPFIFMPQAHQWWNHLI